MYKTYIRQKKVERNIQKFRLKPAGKSHVEDPGLEWRTVIISIKSPPPQSGLMSVDRGKLTNGWLKIYLLQVLFRFIKGIRGISVLWNVLDDLGFESQ